jgi:hypothetical protein
MVYKDTVKNHVSGIDRYYVCFLFMATCQGDLIHWDHCNEWINFFLILQNWPNIVATMSAVCHPLPNFVNLTEGITTDIFHVVPKLKPPVL